MSNIIIEKTKYECSPATSNKQRWQDQRDILKKTGIQVGKVDVMYYSRGVVRNDSSLVPPIRQTASIFKQPVTVYKTQESKVKTDLKHGAQDKPKQLFWEKRLENLRACDIDGNELRAMELPRGLRPVGPNVTDETVVQSVATALHVSSGPVLGQGSPQSTGINGGVSKAALERNPGVFLDPRQPLVHALAVGEDEVRRQEEKVLAARRRLQDALAREN